MTYCMAWKFNDSIYMAGDSAATMPGEPFAKISSTGQIQKDNRGVRVEELALKIAPISSRCTIGMAGNAKVCVDVAKFLKDNYHYGFTIKQLLEMAVGSLGPLQGKCHLLIGQYVDDNAYLYKWKSECPHELSEVKGFADIGSADRYTKALMKYMVVNYICKMPLSQFILPFATGLLVSHSAHANLIGSGVGGCITGLVLTQTGYEWQPDTTYIFYGKDQKINNALSVAVRDDTALVVYRIEPEAINKEYMKAAFKDNFPADFFDHPLTMHRILSLFQNNLTDEEWNDKWLNLLSNKLKNMETKIFSMISLFNRNVVVVLGTGEMPRGKYLSLNRQNGQICFTFHQNLVGKMMLAFEEPSPHPAIDLSFSYFID